MKQKALRAGDAHSHEDEECRKRSTLSNAFGARTCLGAFFLIVQKYKKTVNIKKYLKKTENNI